MSYCEMKSKFHPALFVILLLSLTGSHSEARLGETPAQCADRYGAPKSDSVTKMSEKTFPVLSYALHHTYHYEGWRIVAAFPAIDGPALRMDFSKMLKTGVSQVIKDFEIEAILKAETPQGMTWKPVGYDNPGSPNKGLGKVGEAIIAGAIGQKMWKRTDGATALLRSALSLRLELPAAGEYEKQRKEKLEKRARDSVPKF